MSLNSTRQQLTRLLCRRWHWIGAGCVALSLAGFALGYRTQGLTATVLLVKTTMGDAGFDSSDPQRGVAGFDAGEVLTEMSCRDAIAHRAAAALSLPARPVRIEEISGITSGQGSGMISLRLSSGNPEQTVGLANACAEEAIRTVTDWRQLQLDEIKRQVGQRLLTVDRELQAASGEFLALQQNNADLPFDKDPVELIKGKAELDGKVDAARVQLSELDRRIQRLLVEIQKLAPAMMKAREVLAQARTRFTEEHPKVIELRGALATLEAQFSQQGVPEDPDVLAWSNPAAVSLHAQVTDSRNQRISVVQQLEALTVQGVHLKTGLNHLPAKHVAYVRIKSRYDALKSEHFLLTSRQQHLESLQGIAPMQIVRRATVEDLSHADKLAAALAWAGIGGFMGAVATGLWFLLAEISGGRIRREEDLAQATQLPILGSLDDLEGMDVNQRLLWALHTLTMIRSRTRFSPRGALVCGVASLKPAEGRSTVIRLLAEAAAKQGLKVLTMMHGKPDPESATAHRERGEPCLEPCVEPDVERALRDPAELASRGNGELEPLPPTLEPKPLNKWIWDVALREKWQETLQQWAELERCVIFVELPPLSSPEAFVIADNLPNLLWVARKNAARQSETRCHLEVLSHLQTNWIGAVFNRALAHSRKRFYGLAFTLSLAVGGVPLTSLQAQPTNQAKPEFPVDTEGAKSAEGAERVGSFTVSSPDQLADWQKHLTLGPGDTFQINLYEQPDTAKTGLFIGPDGRLNYLEAQDVMAAGLTVDELRAKLEGILAKYRLSPRVIINPVAYASKKYYLLGNVNLKGVFSLDRPVTIIEAIARAKGFVTTQQYRNALTQADLSHSFLVRRGSEGGFGRVPVDFEGLFQRGELSQNLPLAPDDYLFFPPLGLQEIYVLGEVVRPGAMPYTKDMTVMGAIIAQGSFTTRAYKSKVLVVRGSLNRPQTFVVNTTDILTARGPDFPLSNRDIIYVHRRPFVKAQELLESAVLTFIRSFVNAYAIYNVGPFITEPLVN